MTVVASERVSVFIADDHPVYRDGIAQVIGGSDGVELVGQAGTGRDALDGIRELRPTVALLDVAMPGLSGPEVVHALREEGAATRCVILSAHTESETVYRCIAEGAAGYLSKDATRDVIRDAILEAARGGTVLAPELQAGLMAEINRRESEDRPHLSAREREVLDGISEGLTAPQIARRLHLSTATVKSHLGTLYDKLGVSDRAAAVAVAMRLGLLE